MSLIEKLYGPFFDLENWKTVITSGEDWMIILSLVLIECLLSVDNAIVLAAQTQKLPDKVQQEKSLFYGLWGAYVFRFIMIGLGAYLINFWEVKVFGALYLMYLSLNHFWKMRHPESVHHREKKGRFQILPLFWSVVVSIELMDMVLIGGLIGILCMRGIAEVVMRLMEILPELEVTAYILIALIAVKLFLTIPMIDIEIPAALFGGIVLASLAVTVVVHKIRN